MQEKPTPEDLEKQFASQIDTVIVGRLRDISLVPLVQDDPELHERLFVDIVRGWLATEGPEPGAPASETVPFNRRFARLLFGAGFIAMAEDVLQKAISGLRAAQLDQYVPACLQDLKEYQATADLQKRIIAIEQGKLDLKIKPKY